MTLLIFLIVLSVLIVAHEAGHLFAAKWSGMRVDEFGLGFPPRIKKLFSWKGTDFILNSLPFGGYVKIFGENPNDPDLEDGSKKGFSFVEVSRWKQVFVLGAGVLANFLLAWILLAIVLMLGIESGAGFIQEGLFGAIGQSFLSIFHITSLIVVALFQLLLGIFTGGADLTGLVGPVGLISLVGEASSLGVSHLLYFTSLISLNLAVINLVPLPALDGGRILILVVEKIRRKNLSAKTFNLLNNVSFALLIALMIWVTVRDVSVLL